MDNRRRTYQSLMRPMLIGGAERGPASIVIAFGCMFLALGLGMFRPLTFLLGLTVLVVFLPILQMLAKRDPMMFEVYQRYLRYKAYYPARSTPWRQK